MTETIEDIKNKNIHERSQHILVLIENVFI